LGASRVATSITDAEAFGDLYQWGRGTDGHQKRNSGTTSTLSSTDVPGNGNFILTTDTNSDWRSPQNNSLWQGVNGINNPCPSGFRLPTETEFYNESRSSGGSGPFASSPLKLTRGGSRLQNGLLYSVGGAGYYWASTVKGTERSHLILASNPMFTSSEDPGGLGMSVRCIEDFVVTNTPTTIVEVTNPKTGKTWMDRNLGASRAATSSKDVESYGDLYQWGRRTDGHQNRTSEPGIPNQISSTDIPGNAYFILTNNNNNSAFDWRSPQNNNLWQGVNGINNPCPSGFRLPTETEFNAERLSWNSNNAAGAFASPLKLPLPGYRGFAIQFNPQIQQVGDAGFYWTSSVSGTNSIFTSIEGGEAVMRNQGRAIGFSVRCIKN
jgi:uncharacterized protein (TIGR02145 family)